MSFSSPIHTKKIITLVNEYKNIIGLSVLNK